MNARITNLDGANGGTFINDNAAHVGDWNAIVALTAASGAIISPNITANGAAAGGPTNIAVIAIPAGTTIYGRYTSITLTAGSVIAYNRTER